MMDIVETIKTRRSARRFKPDKISRELLREIVNLASWAPSDMNTQPWQVTILTGRARDKMVKIMSKGIEPLRPLLKKRFPPKIEEATELFFQNMGDAPLILIISGDRRDNEIEQKVVIESCSAFVQNLLLICHSHGLATCWVGSSLHFEKEVLEYLGKADRVLITNIAIGFAGATNPVPPRKRVELEWIE